MKNFVFFVRCAMALVWLYNGLWLKVILRDPHHRAIVASVVGSDGWRADVALIVIGAAESLLALGILSGVAHRFVNGFQIAVLLLMNGLGIAFGGGSIEHPIGLLIGNLPLICCALLALLHGPGSFVAPLKRHE
jgi:uncharacterized membrane protein YphA (DoxX/SURF4 family)